MVGFGLGLVWFALASSWMATTSSLLLGARPLRCSRARSWCGSLVDGVDALIALVRSSAAWMPHAI